MISEGRLPIAAKNLQIIPTDDKVDFAALVEKRSYSADLVILGFTEGQAPGEGDGTPPTTSGDPGRPLRIGGGDHLYRVTALSFLRFPRTPLGTQPG